MLLKQKLQIHKILSQNSDLKLNEKRNEILMLEPSNGEDRVKVAVFCNTGNNRSYLYTLLLKERGYAAQNFGAAGSKPFSLEDLESNDFQAILFVSPKVEEYFHDRLYYLTSGDIPKFNIPIRTLNILKHSGIRGLEENENQFNQISHVEEIIENAKTDLDQLGFIDRT